MKNFKPEIGILIEVQTYPLSGNTFNHELCVVTYIGEYGYTASPVNGDRNISVAYNSSYKNDKIKVFGFVYKPNGTYCQTEEEIIEFFPEYCI